MEMRKLQLHYNSNSLLKPPRCFYTHLQVLDAMHIFSMHFKSSSDAILILLNSSLIHYRCNVDTFHAVFALEFPVPCISVPCTSNSSSMHFSALPCTLNSSSMHFSPLPCTSNSSSMQSSALPCSSYSSSMQSSAYFHAH